MSCQSPWRPSDETEGELPPSACLVCESMHHGRRGFHAVPFHSAHLFISIATDCQSFPRSALYTPYRSFASHIIFFTDLGLMLLHRYPNIFCLSERPLSLCHCDTTFHYYAGTGRDAVYYMRALCECHGFKRKLALKSSRKEGGRVQTVDCNASHTQIESRRHRPWPYSIHFSLLHLPT